MRHFIEPADGGDHQGFVLVRQSQPRERAGDVVGKGIPDGTATHDLPLDEVRMAFQVSGLESLDDGPEVYGSSNLDQLG